MPQLTEGELATMEERANATLNATKDYAIKVPNRALRNAREKLMLINEVRRLRALAGEMTSDETD